MILLTRSIQSGHCKRSYVESSRLLIVCVRLPSTRNRANSSLSAESQQAALAVLCQN